MSRKVTSAARTKMVRDNGRSHQIGAHCARNIAATSIKTMPYGAHHFGTHRALTVYLTRGLRALFMFFFLEQRFSNNWRKD
jgi:hypothetical protein